MSDLPKFVYVNECGPREGFQFEKVHIPTADKIAFVDQLSDTGIKAIQFASFVSPKWVPQMADSDAWVDGIKKAPGVEYTGLWLNLQGLDRALTHRDKLTISPGFSLNASETFSKKNTNRSVAEKLDEMPGYVTKFRDLGFDKLDIGVAVAFGCNYEGAISTERVMSLLADQATRARGLGMKIGEITLYDTMGWGNPQQVKRLVGAVRERYPDNAICLHLHDTRGLAIANFIAGMEVGVDRFDAAVAGLGGCPFAAHKGAAGNICTEDVVFLCQEMGIETGIDLDAMIEAGIKAEELVGHPLPGKIKVGGNLATYRAKASAAAKVAA
ncbi:MAG: hydroxymethylglutaryl-CoA lyase [Betaproteobacteria bacterium]|nr:hydroxymethylglutaryl-CoA lyase [Betaproteobacteria bacterium]